MSDESPDNDNAATSERNQSDTESTGGDDMPPLEDINYDYKEGDKGKDKKIVIPEDKPKVKQQDDGWLDVLDNGELKKFVLTPGEVGHPRPERGCLVTIKITTKLFDTQQVVDSETHESISIIVGDSDFFQGLDLIIPLMDQKEVARVLIKSRFAYGKTGIADVVPPDCTLDCELHLLSVQWIDEEFVWPIDDRIKIGNRKKERGNFWFARQDFSTSIQCYKSALKLLDATDDELESVESNPMKEHFDEQVKRQLSNDNNEDPKVKELIDLRSVTYNNLAMAQMKIDDFNGALKSVDAVLVLQPNNVKALFRKGKIWAEKGELNLAIETLQKALKLEPENKAIAQELAKYGSKRKKELVTEKQLYKRMLELDKKSPNKPSKVLIISGKRKCGKDFCVDLINKYVPNVMVLRIAEPIKQHFAKCHGLDLNQLLSASKYKESYREKMVKWSEDLRRNDPNCFLKLAIDMKNAMSFSRWILSDARRLCDIQYFKESLQYKHTKILTLRVCASNETRAKRGWIYTTGIDDKETECGLDLYTDWHHIINNNSDDINHLMKQLQPIINFLQ